MLRLRHPSTRELQEVSESITAARIEIKTRKVRESRDGWPLTLSEVDFAGPWHVEKWEGEGWETRWRTQARDLWAVIHNAGGKPFAVLDSRETALLIAAILPAVGREPIYEFEYDDDGDGRPALKTMRGDRGYSKLGELWNTDEPERLSIALDVVHGLLVSPLSLALFLQAAPREGLELAGKFAAQGTGG